MVAVPIASMAPPRLYRVAEPRAGPADRSCAAMIVAFLVQPAVSFERLRPLMDVAARNAEWVGLESLLKDKRVLSLVPEIAFHTRPPPVTEPFVLVCSSCAADSISARSPTGSGRASSTWS